MSNADETGLPSEALLTEMFNSLNTCKSPKDFIKSIIYGEIEVDGEDYVIINGEVYKRTLDSEGVQTDLQHIP